MTDYGGGIFSLFDTDGKMVGYHDLDFGIFIEGASLKTGPYATLSVPFEVEIIGTGILDHAILTDADGKRPKKIPITEEAGGGGILVQDLVVIEGDTVEIKTFRI